MMMRRVGTARHHSYPHFYVSILYDFYSHDSAPLLVQDTVTVNFAPGMVRTHGLVL